MDSTSTPTSRFRFRDHDQEIGDEDSSEGRTTADSSSASSVEDDEPELQSMTAKGVQHLCSELLELKQESDEDFQKIIFSNYSTFLVILKEIEGLQSEMLKLKNQAYSQKSLIEDFNNGLSLSISSEENIVSMLDETLHFQPSSPSILESHTENVSEILDILISERRLDEALALLETEVDFVQNLSSGEIFPSDQLTSYNSIISEKRAMLADQFTTMAKNPRINALELQKALNGLCQLGENKIAIQLMFTYYHSRIASGVHDLQSSKELQGVFYIQELAKFVCSMISQGVKSFVALNGENCPYTSELTQWANEEIEIFAVCFNKYIKSVSDVSGKVSTAVEAMKIAISYCSLLETQRIFLRPSLTDHIRPCIEEVLQLHIDHLSEVVRIFTSTDTWVLDRYYISGILTEKISNSVVDQHQEYLFLTNSGRKFVTLFQSVADDMSPLIALLMESSVLKGITDLLPAYIIVLESANAIDRRGFKISLPESSTQGFCILANLSSLMQFSSSIIRNMFDGIRHLDIEIDSYIMFIQDVYGRLKACFLGQFVSNIFSAHDDQFGSEICISGLGVCDLIPSVPYLELFLELKKLLKLAEDDCIDMHWLISLLSEVMDATFEWISNKSRIWAITKENLDSHRTEFMQFILDAQFLVEIARSDGYLSENVINVSTNIISRLEASFVSAGLNPLRDMNDGEWPANAAIRALQKLQELHTNESLEHENEGIESMNNSGTINAQQSVFDANTEFSRTEETPIEKEVDPEEQHTLNNREIYGEVEIRRNEFRDEGEKQPEISSTATDMLRVDEQST